MSVDRSRATLAVLGCLCLAALGASVVWALQRGDAIGAVWVLAVMAMMFLCLGTQGGQGRQALQWDGQRWWLQQTGWSDPAQPGRLLVAIDLDTWVLLRFHADAPARRPRTRWLALQRTRVAGDWHALRCALYSPRPLAPEGAGARTDG